MIAVLIHFPAAGIDSNKPLDAGFGFAGASEDPTCHFERRFFNPERKIVAAGELFALPRPERFERVCRDDEWNPVIQSRESSAEMAVPGVTMNEIGVDVGSVEIDAAAKCAENRLQRFWTSEAARVQFEASDLEPAFFEILIAKTANIDIDRFRQFA